MPTRALFRSLLAFVCTMSAAAAGPVLSVPPPGKLAGPPTPQLLPAAIPNGSTVFQIAPDSEAALRASGSDLRLDNVPINGQDRSLILERFEVFAPGCRFVVARPGAKGAGGGEWDHIATPQVTFWRGSVEGEIGSSVFIAVGKDVTVGSIDLGAGGERFHLSSQVDKHRSLPKGNVAIFKPDSALRVGPAQPHALCGLSTAAEPTLNAVDHDAPDFADGPDKREDKDGERGGVNAPRRLRVQLAIDTDFEYYALFNDVDAAATYVAMLYAQVSDIYLREIKVAIELSFVRIWDTPTDPWDVDGDSLLPVFREIWNAEMGDVPRDLAQLCSGRRDVPWGGIAYINGVCNDSSYSCVGYILGYFPDPSTPHAENYDIMVTAHEIGHNFGTWHTHDYGLDQCHQINTPARRGTIMSYCSQTVSGGNAVMDMGFQTNIRGIMRSYLFTRTCVDRDCNGNSVPDADDISGGTSLDVNQNNVPDECEDCNANGVFDSIDIAQGVSVDRNGNLIPDDCEPDCNNNGRVDSFDISQGTSQDVYKDGIPDECQADCDANGQADYNQIQANMPLDIDRNRVLDSCQDCDADGTNDLFALNGSRNLWVTSSEHDEVIEFYAATGVRMRDATTAGMTEAQDIVITPDRRILVSSSANHRIVEFDRTGAFVRTLVQGGQLNFPAGLLLTDHGTLIVVSRGNARVLEYNVQTGGFVRVVVPPAADGLRFPFGIIRTPAGVAHGDELLITEDLDDSVRRYNPATGAFLGTLVAPGSGGLDRPRGMLVLPDGKLLVTSLLTNQALAYDLATGAPLGQWNRNGTNSVLRLRGPWGIKLGPDGNVYIAVNGGSGDSAFEPPPFFSDPLLHVTNTKVFRFDVRNGNFLTSYVTGQDTGLEHAAGLAFMPLDELLDCNANQFPDSCDIAQGLAQDCNANGRPDSCDIGSGLETDYNLNGVPDACECLADWNHDGLVNSTDVSDFINDWFTDQAKGTLITDFNLDGASNSTDVSDFINAYFTGEGNCK